MDALKDAGIWSFVMSATKLAAWHVLIDFEFACWLTESATAYLSYSY
jgi:hypothetical protein